MTSSSSLRSISIRRRPEESISWVTSRSTIFVPVCWGISTPKRLTSFFASSSSFSRRATAGIVLPCMSRESRVMKKTMLKSVSAPSTWLIRGYVAKMIGTAPLSPTQERNQRPRILILGKKTRHRWTASGRATKIMKSPARSAKPAIGRRLCASTKRPRMMKRAI